MQESMKPAGLCMEGCLLAEQVASVTSRATPLLAQIKCIAIVATDVYFARASGRTDQARGWHSEQQSIYESKLNSKTYRIRFAMLKLDAQRSRPHLGW